MRSDTIELVLEPSGQTIQVPRSIMGAQGENSTEIISKKNPTDPSIYFGKQTSKVSEWLRGDDTLTMKSDTLRRAWREFGRAFTFCTIMPMISLSGNIRVVPCSNDRIAIDNARAIGEWLNIFQADMRQPTLKTMGKPICEWWRLFGEGMFEFRFLRDKSLKLIGYPSGMMLKRVHLIPPYRVPRDSNAVIYTPDGDLIQMKVLTDDGSTDIIKPPTIRRFHHMKNRTEAERRGISFLAPHIRNFASEQDLVNIAVDAFDLFVHPIEQHKIHRSNPNGGPGLTPAKWEETKTAHVAQVKANRWRHHRMYITDEHVDLNLKGAEQKMVDPYNMLRHMERRNMKGAMIPNMFEGEDVNKATMEWIARYSHLVHAVSIDHAAFSHFLERILFPTVLWTMGRDTRYIPTVAYPALRSADRLEDLEGDKLAAEIYGPAHLRQLAAEKGIVMGDDSVNVEITEPGKENLSAEVVLR